MYMAAYLSLIEGVMASTSYNDGSILHFEYTIALGVQPCLKCNSSL